MKLFNYLKNKEKEALNNGLEETGVRRLLIDYFYQSYANLINNYDKEIDEEVFDKIINKYVYEKKSIQYITGYEIFYGRKFKVNENVLIPRPETELLCEKAIEIISNKLSGKVKILDIGTGSGIIPITIYEELKTKELEIDAIDISLEAIKVAKENGKGTNINFYQSDLFENVKKEYNVIISNPPYIPTSFVIDDYVKKNEPNIALFGGEKGLDFYKQIINEIDNYLDLKSGLAYILFEIGCEQGEDVKRIVQEKFYNYYQDNLKIDIYKDFNDLDRMIIIKIGENNG